MGLMSLLVRVMQAWEAGSVVSVLTRHLQASSPIHCVTPVLSSHPFHPLSLIGTSCVCVPAPPGVFLPVTNRHIKNLRQKSSTSRERVCEDDSYVAIDVSSGPLSFDPDVVCESRRAEFARGTRLEGGSFPSGKRRC